MKSTLKQVAVNIYLKLFGQEKVQNKLADKIKQISTPLPELKNIESPYAKLTKLSVEPPSMRDDIVFITSRFRSGSTLLWNLFRQTDGCTSYYEPFNERQWFNKSFRGTGVDNSHRGVDDYWAEYDGLESLGELYNENWIRHKLLMTGDTWAPKMKTYIESLVDMASSRPILQFNRLDFRLPWIRQHFPRAKILHLFRHPRDQWCSFLTDSKVMNKDDVEHTYIDAFYLDVWCNDLAPHYPVLDKGNTPHPYQRFYYLWKLSYLHGTTFSDHSLSFEALTQQPAKEINTMFSKLNIKNIDIEPLCNVIQAPAPERWKKYADDQWFSHHETICERNLSLMLNKQLSLGNLQ